MQGCINFIRWVLSFLWGLIFVPLLIIGIVVSALAITVTNSGNLKSWVERSGVYEHPLDLVTAFLDSTEGGGQPELITQFRLALIGDKELKQEVEKLFTPAMLRSRVNTVVDAVYEWLDGKTAYPEFKLTIVDKPEEFLKVAALEYKFILKSLPACPAGSSRPSDFNPLNTDCLPADFKLSEVDTYFAENADPEYMNYLFQSYTLDSSSLAGKPLPLDWALTGYKVLQLFPLVAPVVLMLWAFILWLLIPGRPRATLITGGIITVVSALVSGLTLLSFVFYEQLLSLTNIHITGSSEALIPYMFKLIRAVYENIGGNLALVGFGYLVVGMLIVIVGLIWHRRHKRKLLLPPEPAPAVQAVPAAAEIKPDVTTEA